MTRRTDSPGSPFNSRSVAIGGRDWQKGVEDLQQGYAAAWIPVYYSIASTARAFDQVMQHCEKRWGSGAD